MHIFQELYEYVLKLAGHAKAKYYLFILIFPHITNLISGRFYYKVTSQNSGPGASFAKQIAYKIVLHVL